jgi:hypothetical protein
MAVSDCEYGTKVRLEASLALLRCDIVSTPLTEPFGQFTACDSPCQ